MTLPFLNESISTANQIANAWRCCMSFDYIEVGVNNGDRPKYRVDQIDNIFSIKLNGIDSYVCLVVILIDDKEPKRFVIRSEMAADLINHVNRRKFLGVLSYEEEACFFQECR